MFRILKPAQAAGQVLDYEARPITMAPPPQALTFVNKQEDGPKSSFELNRLVAQKVGVDEIERKSQREQLEAEVLSRLKEVQEQAYKEAYDLGMDDGRKKAFDDASKEIKQSVQQLIWVLEKLSNYRTELYVANEKSLLKTLFHFAKSIALKEINQDKESIKEVLKSAIENAQVEEKVTVRLSPSDFEFVDKLKGDLSPQFDKLRTIKIESDQGVSSGGCIVETNFGIIDAGIEERVSKLWKVIESKIPLGPSSGDKK